MSYHINDDIVTRTIRNETILVPVMDSMETLNALYTLNETGTTIWDGLKKGLSDHEIVGKLIEKYEIDPQTAQKDVKNIISELKALKIVIETPENMRK